MYPADLEQVLAECGDIREAAVVGRPDADLGEVPLAFVVLEPGRAMTAETVMALFDVRLAPYKHPREIVFVDALPRTALGKIRRSILRERAEARAHVTDAWCPGSHWSVWGQHRTPSAGEERTVRGR